jgi:hypothetical protein
VIIFIGAYGIAKLKPEWLQERFTGFILTAKVVATALIVAGLCLVGLKSGRERQVLGQKIENPINLAASFIRRS